MSLDGPLYFFYFFYFAFRRPSHLKGGVVGCIDKSFKNKVKPHGVAAQSWL